MIVLPPIKLGTLSHCLLIQISNNGVGVTGISAPVVHLGTAFGEVAQFSGSHVQPIQSLGTFQQPTSASYCRWREVDAVNLPGIYELYLHDSYFATGNELLVRAKPASGSPTTEDVYHYIPLVP